MNLARKTTSEMTASISWRYRSYFSVQYMVIVSRTWKSDHSTIILSHHETIKDLYDFSYIFVDHQINCTFLHETCLKRNNTPGPFLQLVHELPQTGISVSIMKLIRCIASLRGTLFRAISHSPLIFQTIRFIGNF